MITITMQEVLKAAIDQLEMLSEHSGEPMLESTKVTIKMLNDAVNSWASLENVVLDETSYSKPVVTKQELVTRLYNLMNEAKTVMIDLEVHVSTDDVSTSGLLLTLNEAEQTLSKIIK